MGQYILKLTAKGTITDPANPASVVSIEIPITGSIELEHPGIDPSPVKDLPVSGYVKVNGQYFGPAEVTLTTASGQQTMTTNDAGYFNFTSGGSPGDVLNVTAQGYTFPSVKLDSAVPYYIVNGIAKP